MTELSEQDSALLEQARQTIENATPEQIAQAQELRQRLPEMQKAMAGYIMPALKKLIYITIDEFTDDEKERKKLKRTVDIDDTIICDKIKFYNKNITAASTNVDTSAASAASATSIINADNAGIDVAVISAQVCTIDYNVTEEIMKLKAHLSPENAAILDKTTSQLMSKVPFYYKMVYCTYSGLLDKICGGSAEKLYLLRDATHCIFTLKQGATHGISVKINYKSDPNFIQDITESVGYYTDKMFE